MTSSLRKRPFLIIILVAIILLVAFFGRELVRDFVARPLLYSLWHAWYMSRGFPEVMVWALFVAAIPVIAIFNLIVSGRESEPEPVAAAPPQQGQVQTVVRLLKQAPKGEYFKTRLYQHLSAITLDCLGYRERLSEKEVRALLKSGDLELDPAVLAAIKQGWRQRVESPAAGKNRSEQTAGWLAPKVEKILQYLEAELDI